MDLRILLVAGLLVLSGCSTNKVSLDYQTPAGVSAQTGQAIVRVGDFVDARKGDAHLLGAIRNGYGAPMKTLVTDAPVSNVVREAFSKGLAARGMLNDTPTARYTLTATIEKFDCSQYVRREAHAEILLTLNETANDRTVMSENFTHDIVQNNSNLFDVGAFASTDDLRAVALQALQEIIDISLNSPKLRQALMGQSG